MRKKLENKIRAPLTAERLREVAHYDPETGIWTALIKRATRLHPGDRLGSLDKSRGYRQISIDGQLYRSSRLAYLYMVGTWPEQQIDHIDRDRSNDAWANLRPATQTQNAQNRNFRGVSWHKGKKKWRARIQVDGKRKELGDFDSEKEAYAASRLAREVYFGEFSSFEVSLSQKRRRPEQAMQRAVMRHIDVRLAPGAFIFHVPNAAKRSRAEGGIFKSMGVRAGVPDLICIKAGRVCALELKSERGRLSKVQKRCHDEFRQAGAVVAVADNLDDALGHLERWGILRGNTQ